MDKVKFKSLRIKEETVEKLADVQLAFESTYMQHLTKDELVQKLIDCIEDSEPAVWETLCFIREKKEKGNDR